MRKRKLIAVVLAVIVLAVAVISVSRSHEKPAISIAVINYRTWGDGPSLAARLAITNSGSVSIRCNLWSFNESSMRIETTAGWRVPHVGPWGFSPVIATLPPGSNMVTTVYVPGQTTRWQIGYKICAASPQALVAARLSAKWRARLLPVCKRLLSDEEGPETEVWSAIFEAPMISVHAPSTNEVAAGLYDFERIGALRVPDADLFR